MTEKLGDMVRTWWPVVTAAAMLLMGYATMTTQLKWISDGQTELVREVKAISASLAGTEVTAQFTRSHVADLEQRVRDLERRR